MTATDPFTGNVPALYDQYLGPVLFEPYARDIASRIHAESFRNVLEIACGTGRVTRHLLAQLPAGGKIVASDLNEDMLALARQRVTDSRVEWQMADAQDLPFDDQRFDHVVCQFGLMFFPDKARAFSEARRVLAPGGRFLFNVWDSVAANPRSAIVPALLSKMLGDNAPDFLNKGPYSFCDRELIGNMLDEAGFSKLRADTVPFTTAYPSAAHLVKGFVDGSPLAAYLVQQPASFQREFREQLAREVIAAFGEGSIPSPMQALVFSAER